MEKIFSVANSKLIINKKNILNKFNLDIYKGDSIGVFGPNGAGKTTLINAIIEKMSLNTNLKISYVMQNSIFFDSLINIYYWFASLNKIKKTQEEITKQFKYWNIEKFKKTPFTNLSEGQKQKFRLLLAFIEMPDILILDEPIAALDYNAQIKFIELVKKMKKMKKITIILISHSIVVATNLIEKYVILNNGEVSKINSLKKTNKKRQLISIFKSFSQGMNV